MNTGQNIYFLGEKKPYTVKAFDGRYAICTKPFNLQKTVLYTIVDLEMQIRGTNNLTFNIYDYTKQQDIDECLLDLQSGEVEISHRNRVPLRVVEQVSPIERLRNKLTPFVHLVQVAQDTDLKQVAESCNVDEILYWLAEAEKCCTKTVKHEIV